MLLDSTAHALTHRLATEQSRGRAPSLVGGVVRDGALVWSGARGLVGNAPPHDDTQYRIGSITKTFVAVLVLRLREEGLLSLDDELGRHVKLKVIKFYTKFGTTLLSPWVVTLHNVKSNTL